MIEKIIKYYEEDILMTNEWNKINLMMLGASILIFIVAIWLNQKSTFIALIVEIILLMIAVIMLVLRTINIIQKVLDKNNIKVDSKIINIIAWRRELKEKFRPKKIEQIKLKLYQEKIDKEGQKILLDSLHSKYNELCSNKNVFLVIFSFIAATVGTWIKFDMVKGSFVIEGLYECMAIIVASGIILYSLNKVVDEVFLHIRDKKENLKVLISIIEEICMVKD